MNATATLTLVKQPDEIESAWAEHEYRNDVAKRYFKAIHAKDWDEAGFVWLEAAAYDKAHENSSSPLVDELGLTDLPAAA
jgi:hypothetical protein